MTTKFHWNRARRLGARARTDRQTDRRTDRQTWTDNDDHLGGSTDRQTDKQDTLDGDLKILSEARKLENPKINWPISEDQLAQICQISYPQPPDITISSVTEPTNWQLRVAIWKFMGIWVTGYKKYLRMQCRMFLANFSSSSRWTKEFHGKIWNMTAKLLLLASLFSTKYKAESKFRETGKFCLP